MKSSRRESQRLRAIWQVMCKRSSHHSYFDLTLMRRFTSCSPGSVNSSIPSVCLHLRQEKCLKGGEKRPFFSKRNKGKLSHLSWTSGLQADLRDIGTTPPTTHIHTLLEQHQNSVFTVSVNIRPTPVSLNRKLNPGLLQETCSAADPDLRVEGEEGGAFHAGIDAELNITTITFPMRDTLQTQKVNVARWTYQ